MENEHKKNIWERSVGVRLKEIKKKNGESFQAFEFVRFYSDDVSGESKYTSLFTERNLESLEMLLGKLRLHFSQNANSTKSDEGLQVLAKIKPKRIPSSAVVDG